MAEKKQFLDADGLTIFADAMKKYIDKKLSNFTPSETSSTNADVYSKEEVERKLFTLGYAAGLKTSGASATLTLSDPDGKEFYEEGDTIPVMCEIISTSSIIPQGSLSIRTEINSTPTDNFPGNLTELILEDLNAPPDEANAPIVSASAFPSTNLDTWTIAMYIGSYTVTAEDIARGSTTFVVMQDIGNNQLALLKRETVSYTAGTTVAS